MEKITGNLQKESIQYMEFAKNVGKIVSIQGIIHRIREMTDFAFVILRTSRDVVQCIYSPKFSIINWMKKYKKVVV